MIILHAINQESDWDETPIHFEIVSRSKRNLDSVTTIGYATVNFTYFLTAFFIYPQAT